MTPQDAAFVLGPIWQGFASARCRLAKIREQTDLGQGMSAMARHVCETQDAEAYLEAVLNRFLCPASGGLLTVIASGRKTMTWPNAHPPTVARTEAEVNYFTRRFEAEFREAPIQTLRTTA